MSEGSKACISTTNPSLIHAFLDMKTSPGSMTALSENKDNFLPVKDTIQTKRKSNKSRSSPASHRKTRINSISKRTLRTVRLPPDIPPPFDMTTDCMVANHFLPPAKICADDDDEQDISSETFDDQHMNNKACALCNRGMETRPMQGAVTRYEPTAGFNIFELQFERNANIPRKTVPDVLDEPTVIRRGPGRPPGKGRKKGTVINGFSILNSNPNLPLDMVLFGSTQERYINELFEVTGHTWCHSCCALWSEGVQQDETSLKYVDRAVFQAMTQKCNHCNNYGASVACNDKNCTKKFHYTCASSGGCFQEVKSKTVLCADHIGQAEGLVGEDARCAVCDCVGDLSKQLFCCNCWRHYHGNCLQPEVDVLPSTRMGWHCPECKICNDCGLSNDDNKMLVCDICDKGYHFYCLKPPVVTIPKDGWKCENCRRCQDCGSSTPGSGATSRWHLNYTVCDSCYQQRNKGLSCPLCGRAYRHISEVPMVQCTKCEKSVHRECDEANADMVPYRCANCRVLYKHEPLTDDVKPMFAGQLQFGEDHAGMLSPNQLSSNEVMLSSMSDPSLTLDMNINPELEPGINMDCNVESVDSYDLGEKLPFYEEMEVELNDEYASSTQFPESFAPRPPIARKTTISAGKQGGKRKLGTRRARQGGAGTGKKRGKGGRPGSKLKNKALPPSLPDKENVPHTASNQEDPSKHTVEGLKSSLVLFSTDDQRMKTQDMCRCCGSFGQGVEGRLIPCSQCGQCYHPYCVNVKINKVIITKGWRCLDCTFCEGCGKGSDEARLLLCDSCDISYHTYCLDPPLDHVPHGGWKCKWCVVCTLCSRTTPGKSCKWMSNYTQCGPCASLTTCPICKNLYKVDDLMIQCIECERWLHAYCDQFTNEDDVERAADAGYKCYYCRPKSQSYFSFTSSVTTTSRWSQSTVNTITSMSSYGFGSFGPSSPKATSIQHYHPGPGRKPLHPVQRHGSKGTVEMSLASRIALGNTGESCSPAIVFLTESGKRHIDESKGRPTKVINKKRQRQRNNKVKKVDGEKSVAVERTSVQTARISSQINPGGENDDWPARQPSVKKAVTKRRVDVAKAINTAAKDNQLHKLQENFFGRTLLMSTSSMAENDPNTQASVNIAQSDITESVSQAANSVSWPTPSAAAPALSASAHSVSCAPIAIDTLPAAPDLNLPDPDVLVNQLGMLVTAAEGEENMRNEPLPSTQGGRLTADTRTGYPDGSGVSSSGSQEEVHHSGQRRQTSSHELDILVPPSGDLPMVDSKDIEDFFSGIENELNQQQTGLISDPLLSSAGVHVTSNPASHRPPPPPYPHASRGQYPREVHGHAWGTMQVGEPPPYQSSHQERLQTGIDLAHNGPRVEPEFEHIDDDFGPRRPRPESPRADSHKQLLKWQEDEKLGAMATISPVLYANLKYPNLRDEYPEWVPRYRAMARLWRKLKTEEREPFRHKARDNRVKLKDQMKRTVSGGSKLASTKELDASSNAQLTMEAQVPLVNGLPHQSLTGRPSTAESEIPVNAPYAEMVPRPPAPNPPVNKHPLVNMINNPEKSQVIQLAQQHNVQYHFANQPFQQGEPVMNITQSHHITKGNLMSPTGTHILTTDLAKKDKTSKRNRGEKDKEKELKDKKNQIWQEREREWKLLQQQRQLENRKQQQQQNQDSFSVRKEVRTKASKTPDWRKNTPLNETTNNPSQIAEKHGQAATSTKHDNTVQIQLSNYISSSQHNGSADQQHPSIMSVPQAERVVEHSQSSSSFQIQTVAMTTTITSVENPAPYWTQDASRGNSRPATPSRILSRQSQNWMGQHDQQQQPLQLQEQSIFHQPTLPSSVPQVLTSTPNTPISVESDPHHPVSSDPSLYQSPTQHLTRPEMPAPHLSQNDLSELEQSRQKQQEALQKHQQIQQLQKQQQLQQQEVLQREQRKQLVLAQHQQQEYIQMHLKHQRFPQQQPYQSPQPPRQANQFTTNSKEMPEIDTEEEHQERLQYLYRQRQVQKQLQARQYVMQQQTPAHWVNSAQMMQGIPQAIRSDPVQQRILLEQQRASQQRQRVNMEKTTHGHHPAIPSSFSQATTPAVDSSPKFNFHQLAKNGQNDVELSSQVTSISSYSLEAEATSQATTTAILSETVSGKSEKKKRKDRRNSTIDLSMPNYSGHIGVGFPNAEPEPQHDISVVNHSGTVENELLPVSQETCITVDEGHARRVETTEPGFGNDESDKKEQHPDQGTGDDLNVKSMMLPPYGTANLSLPNNQANQQLVLPPPQLALSPQQQHMLLQAQQQQLLWQQAHSQLQHQYQLLYQQLQQLQVQLQQTQDPALHQRVLRQQQQLRFLQTQILQHWQQGQLVVQQIHLQAFGLNAMLNQMDPAQQKHMQVYQQELVRQQQQWAQQFGGVIASTDIFGRIPGVPQDNRPHASEDKPKRNRRSRTKSKNPPKDATPPSSVPSIELAVSQAAASVQNALPDSTATTITSVTRNGDPPNDAQQEQQTAPQEQQTSEHQGEVQQRGPQQNDYQGQRQSQQPIQQQAEPLVEHQLTNQQQEQQRKQMSQQQQTQEQQIQQLIQQQQLHQQQQQLVQQQQHFQQQQQQLHPVQHQPYQDMVHHEQQQRQPEQQQVDKQIRQQGQLQQIQQSQHMQQPQHSAQPVVDHMQLQLQHRPYEPQPPATPQLQISSSFQQSQVERQAGEPFRTHGEISSSAGRSEVTRDHSQAVLDRRSTSGGRSKAERRQSAVSDDSFRPQDHNTLRPSQVNDAPHRKLGTSPTSTVKTRGSITSSSTVTDAKDTGNKNQAPKALEKLEMMVADIEDQAKKTEVETARRVEDMQNEEFLSETLTVVNMSTDMHPSPAGQKDVDFGRQDMLTNIHSLGQPEVMKIEEKLSLISGAALKQGHEFGSPKSSADYAFAANLESKELQRKTDVSQQKMEGQEIFEVAKPEVRKEDEQLKVKRQLQIEERDRKLSEKKRIKGFDRKHGKKEATRRSTKSKKVKLTDEAIVQSLKELPPLQLCEPEFLMSSLIIQPSLNGLSRGQAVFRGSFGSSYIVGLEDYYANSKFPDVKECLGNPPTPPTSLPPSPTLPHVLNKEQRVYDMLAERTHRNSVSLFPTPPYGDTGVDVKNTLANSSKLLTVDRLQRSTIMFEEQAQTLASNTQNAQHKVYPAFVIDKGLSVRSRPENSLPKENDVNKIYNDVNVTLTISTISDKTVHETVNAISELINVDAPTKLTVQPPVRNASAVYLDTNERIGNVRLPADKIDERIISTGDSDLKKFCRHCDVKILGIGVIRNSSAENEPSSSDSKPLDYSNVNVEDGMNEGRDIFCSSACLKQYHSLDTAQDSSSKESSSKESSTVSTPEEELKTKGLTTSNDMTDDENVIRGHEVAEQTSRVSLGKSHLRLSNDENKVQEKRCKKAQWRRWKEAPSPSNKHNELSDDEIFQLLVKHGTATEVKGCEVDTRRCVLCFKSGDGETDGTARLLNVDLDAWVHLNCALWSHEVYETQNGALMNVEDAIKRGEKTECVVCHGKGATILCNKLLGACLVNCSNSYHFQCARDDGCLFFKDKTVLCPKHQSDYLEENILASHTVFRKVFVNRQEIEQIAKMLSHNQTSEKPYSFRIGNLILNSIGQLLPHQVQAFHTRDSVYPVGFSTTRIYWSMRVVGRRCRYQCHVTDVDGDPHFVVKVEEEGYEEVSFDARTPRDAWLKILEPVETLRKDTSRVNLFSGYITGEDLFGLSEPLIVRIVESMPGVDQMQGYNMRYGRSPIMELPLAINPSGCARSEPLLRTHFKRPARARRSTNNASSATAVVVTPEELSTGLYANNYSKQFAISKTQQYRKLKCEWRSNVLLARSRIQGLGLFANRDLEGNNMVIEYIGSIIRNEVANKRERIYESQNHGVYMFRIDNDSVIDATIAGGPARYINHSCQPNCVAEVVRFEREQKIIIISNRRIEKGEELTYDYKFDFEDDQHKIPCLCGAVNCRKWMN